MRTVECPPPDQLSAYVIGKLSPDVFEDVAERVEGCPSCELSLHILEKLSDPLLSGLRQSFPANPMLAEPELEAALGKAEAMAHLPTSSSGPSIGRLGPYELIEKAGQGGMGVVYKARHTLLDRIDAVKVLPGERTSDGEAVKRFLREMKVVGQLSHPNLIQARYADQIDGTWLLVTDWVDGETLTELVQRDGPMSAIEACDAICQAAIGLQHAHERGVVHRDVKPGNLMRSATGEIKVLDLGLARLRGEFGLAGDATGSGMILGTADYIAPEQVGEAKHADVRADIYSLGCTLYYLLSGQVPFPKANTLQKLLAHQEQEPEQLERIRSGLPTGLAAVVAQMMAKAPAARHQSMIEVVAALRPFTRTSVAVSAVPVESTLVLRQQVLAEIAREESATKALPTKSRRWVAVVLGLVFVAVVAAGIIFKLQGKNGVVIVEVMETDVEVLVNGVGFTLESKTTGPIRIEPGEHEIIVKRGDETLYTKSFRLEKRGKEIVRATWQTKPVAPIVKAPLSVLDRLDPDKNPLLRQTGWPKEVVGVIGSRREDGKLGYYNHVALSKSGKKLLVGSSVTGEPFGLWDLELIRELHRWSPQPNHGLGGFAISPDESLIVAWFAHDHIRLYDPQSGKEQGTLGGPDDVVMDAAFSPDGKLLAASHRDGHNQPCTIKLWDMKERKEVGHLKGHQHYVYSLAWSPDGKYLLTASSDRTTRLWEVAGRREVGKREEMGEKATVISAAFSAEGRLAASAGDVNVIARLWTVSENRLHEHRNLVKVETPSVIHALAFRADGSLLAGSTNDGDLIVWDTTTGKMSQTWKMSKGIYKLTFAPDGRHLIVGCGDGSVCILRLATK